MKDVIIYDFDGVLVNSGFAVLKYYDVIFEHFNLPKLDWHNAEVRKQAFAMSHRQLMSQYADGELLEEMCSYTPPFTMEQMLQVTPLEPEVDTVIPALAKNYPKPPATAGIVFNDDWGRLSEDAFLHNFAGDLPPEEAHVLLLPAIPPMSR